jgi:hypothetical protein
MNGSAETLSQLRMMTRYSSGQEQQNVLDMVWIGR